ncbi:unnamed protein product [Caenorhabditis brenneri]
MGSVQFDQKIKNMQMELEVYKNYIHDQNIFYKEKLESKENEHRQEMDNILLQKNNQIERIQRELVERQPLNNMQQAHNLLLRSKDADIQKLRRTLDDCHHELRNKQQELQSKDISIQQLREKLDLMNTENKYLQKVQTNYQTSVNDKNKIIEDLKQKNSALEALNEQERTSYSTKIANTEETLKKDIEMLQNKLNKSELKEKKLQDTIKRLDSPDYKKLGKIKRLEEEIEKQIKSLESNERALKILTAEKNQSDDKLRISSEKLLFTSDVIIKLRLHAQETLNRILSVPLVGNNQNDDIYKTKYSNILEKICDECDVITGKLKENTTLDYSVVSELETTIESLQPEIERLSGGLEIDCALCKQSLVFPKCTKCNQIFHGECVHRTFVDKNSPSCCFCTNKQSIALAFEFVPVQQSGRVQQSASLS